MDTSNNIWTEEIRAKDPLLSINFREVWRYKDLLLMLIKRDFITFYKQTILGPVWFFLQPIMTMTMYVILFGQIAKISTDGVPKIIFYLSGIIIWNYFSEALTKISTMFKDNAAMLGKVYFPRLIMPCSIVISGLMKFAIQFGLFILLVLYFSLFQKAIHPNLWVLATPFLILLMAAFALGLGMILSSLTIKYKDIIFLLTFGVQLLMYATPVIYPMSFVPAKYKAILMANPLTGIFECFRYGYLGAGNFKPSDLILSIVLIFIFLALGIIIFNKAEKNFTDTI